LEKPSTPEEIVTDLINAGCYVFTRSVIEQIPAGRVVSVERETFPGLLSAGAHVRGVVDRGYWLDLGTPLAFVQGSRDLVSGVAPSPAVPDTGQALVLHGAQVAASAHVGGGTSVGRDVVVAADAMVDGSVLFDGAVIEAGAHVTGSIIGAGARIGEGSVLVGVVVGDGAVVGARNELREGARVWPGVELPDLAIRYSSDA
jgi:mannose-1-phosphate guanylyltransferase